MAAMVRRHKLTLRARCKKARKEGVSPEVLQVLDALKLENPHIALVMKETHVDRPFTVSFPEEFPMPNATTPVMILGATSQRYPAMWLVKPEGKRLAGGWRQFAADYKLVRGDVCVFEITSFNCSTIVVHVFYIGSRKLNRVLFSEESTAATDEDDPSNQQQLEETGPKKPTAYVLITVASVNPPFELEFSKVFAKTMMPQTIAEVMLLDTASQAWPATWLGTSEDSQRLCGLEVFVASHQLKAGDLCRFELVNRAPLTFMVHIFEARRQEDFDHKNQPLKVPLTEQIILDQGPEADVECGNPTDQLGTACDQRKVQGTRSMRDSSLVAAEKPSGLNLPLLNKRLRRALEIAIHNKRRKTGEEIEGSASQDQEIEALSKTFEGFSEKLAAIAQEHLAKRLAYPVHGSRSLSW